MRDLIVRLCQWIAALLGHQPHRRRLGRHSAAYLAASPQRPASRPGAGALVPHGPAYPPPHVRERYNPLPADDVAPIRPYLIAHERKVESLLQRERRTAAALATLGIDYDPRLALAGAAA